VILHNNAIINAKYSARCNGLFTQSAKEGVWDPFDNCKAYGNSISYLKSVSCTHSDFDNCSQTSESPCCLAPNARAGQDGYIFGHGVGMCQRGMMRLGQVNGYSYQQIINHYYTGVCIANIDSYESNCHENVISLNESETIQIHESNEGNQISSHICTENETHLGSEQRFVFIPYFDGDYELAIDSDSNKYTIYQMEHCSDSICLDYSFNDVFSLDNAEAGEEYYFIVDHLLATGSNYSIEIVGTSINTDFCSALKRSNPFIIDTVITDSAFAPNYENGSANIIVSNGDAPYSYLLISQNDDSTAISSTNTSHLFENLTASEYFLEVSDANGCNDFYVFTIDSASTLTNTPDTIENTTDTIANPTDTTTNTPDTLTTFCDSISIHTNIINFPSPDSAIGNITASVQGVPSEYDFSYQWNNGNVTHNITQLSSDWYFVTVTIPGKCEIIDSIYLPNDSSQITQTTCSLSVQTSIEHQHSAGLGTSYIQVLNGNPPYRYFTYLNDSLISTTPFTENLVAGNYLITTHDNGYCIDSVNIEILYIQQTDSNTTEPNDTTTTQNPTDSTLNELDTNLTTTTELLSHSLNLSIYPNPGSNFFVINNKDLNQSDIQVMIYSSLGAKVMDRKLISKINFIDTSKWTNGIYFLHFTSVLDKINTFEKIIISHD